MKSLSEVTMKNAIEDIAWGPVFLIVELYSKKQWHCPPKSVLSLTALQILMFWLRSLLLLKRPNPQRELRWAELKSRLFYLI